MPHQQRVHRHVTERIVAFLTVPQQASARRASKGLWEAVTAASMEDMLRATVFDHHDNNTIDAQLVVVAMSRAHGPFPCGDALVAWSGGLGPLYEEMQLRFPDATAIGVSSRLAAIRPFPFASGFTAVAVCVVTAVASAPLALVVESVALESIVLGVRDVANVLVRVLSHNSAPCPILCLEGATSEQFPNMMHDVPLSSLPSIRSVEKCAFSQCASLQSVCFANLPVLESICDCAFADCVHLSKVDFSGLPSLKRIGDCAFRKCESLKSISFANLPLCESIGLSTYARCVRSTQLRLLYISFTAVDREICLHALRVSSIDQLRAPAAAREH